MSLVFGLQIPRMFNLDEEKEYIVLLTIRYQRPLYQVTELVRQFLSLYLE